MNYYRPEELSKALSWLASHKAGIAAGCTDLFASTDSHYLKKSKLENVLDITALSELKGITKNDKTISIGAATSWSEIIAGDLPPAFDGLKAAAREIGSVQIQNSGTIGGNICNASPAADGVPPLLTLDARVRLDSATGSRSLPLSEFLTGPRRTALKPGEILTSIQIPQQATEGKSSFIKLGARKYLVISIVMAAIRMKTTNGIIEEIAICVGSCSAVAMRIKALEKALIGRTISDSVTIDNLPANLSAILEYELAPIDDIRANAKYRIEAAGELIIRAIRLMAQESGNR